MSVTAIAPIESWIHTTNTWLKELMEELGWDDRQRAYRALAAVLHALRDRLSVAEAADLGAQLPMLIRGLYYEGWSPKGKPIKERKREDFLAHIAAAFPGTPDTYPEAIAWGVFRILERHLSSGEISDILHTLPTGIRSLWPAAEPSMTR
jgi:uncharacterized protein (DUF2267 family)